MEGSNPGGGGGIEKSGRVLDVRYWLEGLS